MYVDVEDWYVMGLKTSDALSMTLITIDILMMSPGTPPNKPYKV